MSFKTQLTITQSTRDWREWYLKQPLVYEYKGRDIRVHRRFLTDGTSIPRPLWNLLPVWGRYARAAVIHDYLYARLSVGIPHEVAPSRHEADEVFYKAMLDLDVMPPVRWTMYEALRLFGRLPTHRKREDFDAEV